MISPMNRVVVAYGFWTLMDTGTLSFAFARPAKCLRPDVTTKTVRISNARLNYNASPTLPTLVKVEPSRRYIAGPVGWLRVTM